MQSSKQVAQSYQSRLAIDDEKLINQSLEESKAFSQRIIKGALGTGLSGALGRVLSLLTAMILARSLGAEGYGFYSFALAVIGFVTIPAQLGLPQLLMRETAASYARKEWSLMRGLRQRASQLSAITVVVSVVILLGVSSILGHEIVALDRQTFLPAIVLLPLLVALAIVNGLLKGLRLVVHATWPISVLQPAVFLLGLLIITVWGFSLDPQMSVIVYILTIVVTLTVAILLLNKFWPRNAYHVKPLFRNRSWTKSLIPFTLISGISVIYQKTDILMLGAMTTAEDVGVYNVAVQGAVLVSFAIYIFTNVLSPNIVSLHAQGEHHRLQRLFNLSTIGMSALAGIVFFGFIGLGEWLLETVFGAAYVSAYLPLCILSGAHFFSAIIGPAGSYLSMTGHEKRTLNALAYTAILNVVLNAFFISKFGIMGAASATALSVIFCNLFLGLQVYRYLDIIPGPIRPKTNEVDRSNT